jgi:uncharacterized protein (TIGR00369 family)
MDAADPDSLQADPDPVQWVSRAALTDRMGVTLVEASPERAVGTMPVEGNTQPMGLLHGGASCVLAETLGSVAATLHAMEVIDGYAVGLEISATHHRSVSGDVRDRHYGRGGAARLHRPTDLRAAQPVRAGQPVRPGRPGPG